MKLLYKVERVNGRCVVLDNKTFELTYEDFQLAKNHVFLDKGQFVPTGYKYVDNSKGLFLKDKLHCIVVFHDWILDIDFTCGNVRVNNSVIDIPIKDIYHLCMFGELRNKSIVLEFYSGFSIVLLRNGVYKINNMFTGNAEKYTLQQFKRTLLL